MDPMEIANDELVKKRAIDKEMKRRRLVLSPDRKYATYQAHHWRWKEYCDFRQRRIVGWHGEL